MGTWSEKSDWEEFGGVNKSEKMTEDMLTESNGVKAAEVIRLDLAG